VAATSDEAIEAEVLAYLDEHPNAMDTLSGIANWWLERQRIRVEVTALWHAVRRLVERGMLQKIGDGDDPLYRIGRKPIDSATK
jgi:hypothetical protein